MVGVQRPDLAGRVEGFNAYRKQEVVVFSKTRLTDHGSWPQILRTWKRSTENLTVNNADWGPVMTEVCPISSRINRSRG